MLTTFNESDVNRNGATGEFGVIARSGNGVTLQPAITAEAARDIAREQMWAAQERVAALTTHMVAVSVLEVCPTAAFLELDSYEHECGITVHSGSLLDAGEREITEELGQMPDEDPEAEFDFKDTSELQDAVNEALQSMRDLEMAAESPAVSSASDPARGRYDRYRIDLRAALALYPHENVGVTVAALGGSPDDDYDAETYPPCVGCGARVMDIEACPNMGNECLDCCPCEDH